MRESLKNELKSLPNSAGIYQYFDENSRLLYVGKAKVLKNRVKSYFSFTPNFAPNPRLSPRIAQMIKQTSHIEWITTASESDALILENSFIKQLRPKYNILLRDDKTYPYIFIDFSDDFPRPKITRKLVNSPNVRYFGPFYKGAKDILEALYEIFALVQKNGCIKQKKACIFAQINRCKAPCENKISKDEYKKILNEAINALKNPSSLLPFLQNKMLFHAKNENYEQAAHLRDQISTINDISIKVKIDLARLEDFESIAIAYFNGYVCSLRLSIRAGIVAYTNHFIMPVLNFDESSLNDLYKQSILDAFAPNLPLASTQIYTHANFEDLKLCEQVLQERHSKKISIKCPKIGEKKSLVDLAYKNCLELIKKHTNSQKFELLSEIQKFFGLQNLPVKIECFDNSQLFGTAKVGAMISWENGEFNKNHYRHIHLKNNNDYDQMKELLTNRALRFDKLSAPDLWLIDGGKALLDLAKDIILSCGANVDILAISKEKIDAKVNRAKGRAQDKIHSPLGEIKLSSNDAKLMFLQNLRDEAHRFAITFHKKVRDKANLEKSKLISLGLSAGKIKKLLDYFENFNNIKNAKFSELEKILGSKTAKKVFDEILEK